jgi:hypothetical protein
MHSLEGNNGERCLYSRWDGCVARNHSAETLDKHHIFVYTLSNRLRNKSMWRRAPEWWYLFVQEIADHVCLNL